MAVAPERRCCLQAYSPIAKRGTLRRACDNADVLCHSRAPFLPDQTGMTEGNPPLSKFFSRLFAAPIAELPRKLKGRAEREACRAKGGSASPLIRWHRPGAAAGITSHACEVPFLTGRGKTHFAPGPRRERERAGSIHCCGAHTPGLSAARVRRSIVLRKGASSVRREGHQRRVGIASSRRWSIAPEPEPQAARALAARHPSTLVLALLLEHSP